MRFWGGTCHCYLFCDPLSQVKAVVGTDTEYGYVYIVSVNSLIFPHSLAARTTRFADVYIYGNIVENVNKFAAPQIASMYKIVAAC